MKRPIGALALAILTLLQGVYSVYVTLIYLGLVSFAFLGQSVSYPQAQWGQAVLSGIVALAYFVISYGFWTVRIWSWIYGLLITAFNLIWLLFAVVGPVVTLESVLVPVLLNLGIFAYLYSPGTREAFYESEGARADAMMDARESDYTPTHSTPPSPPAAPPPAGSDDSGAAPTG
jgi:hypothetical protein